MMVSKTARRIISVLLFLLIIVVYTTIPLLFKRVFNFRHDELLLEDILLGLLLRLKSHSMTCVDQDGRLAIL